MNQISDTQDSKPTPSRLWRIVRLIPIVLMLLTLGFLAILLMMGGIMKITAWYTLQFVPPILGLISIIVVGIYSIAKKRLGRLVSATLVISIVSLLPAILIFKPVTFPMSLKKANPSATVRLPADAPLKVAWGGDSIETNYHAVTPDQRWAYDFLVEPYVNGSDNVEDYGCYGIPVLAPASGLVTIAHDGEPDEVPGVASNNYTAPTGNYVVIQLPETKTYLVIAHLQPNSVAVKAGETVEEGQVIGACGNSGNTSEPHIHIHHQKQDPAIFPLNFAEGLPLYFRDHDGDPMPVGGIEVDGDNVTLVGDTVQHIGE